MAAGILIVGQGLAGTMLGWEFERAGVPFTIVDAGHASGASKVAAGILNPVTGQRIVKSWRVDTLLPLARESYQTLEKELGVPLWREMNVRRFYANDDERRVLQTKQASGEVAGYVETLDAQSFRIKGAAHVDVAKLIAAARERWLASGRLHEAAVAIEQAREEHELIIDCTGAFRGPFDVVGWQFAKGECLSLSISGLKPGEILNRGHWVLPTHPGFAKVGATHVPGRRDVELTLEARATLEASVRQLTPQPFQVFAQDAGVRTYSPDKKPVVGRHPDDTRLGVCKGLGGKGVFYAPALARQWINHLTEGVPFDAELDVARFWRKTGASQPSH